MNDFAMMKQEREAGNVNTIYLKDFTEEQKAASERYSIKKGKVSYDLAQTKMINDVLGIAGNAIMQVGTGAKSMLWDNAIDWEPGKSLADYATEMEENDKLISQAMKPYRDKAREYKNNIDEELANETSATQSFVAGMAIHTLRQGLDIRQWPMLAASSVVGGGVGAVAGKAFSGIAGQTIGKRIGSAVGRFAEEFGEELADQYANDGKFDFGAAAQSGLGAVVIGEIPGLAKKGLKKTSTLLGFGVKAEAKADVKVDTSKADADYVKNVETSGTETAVKIDDAVSIAQNTELHAATKGKNVEPSKILKSSVTIEGTTVKTAGEEYLPKMARYVINSKMIKGVTTEREFINSLKNNPKQVKDIFRKLSRKKDLPENIKEAAQWYGKVLDEKRIKNVDVDAVKIINATDEALDGRQPYEPMFRKTKVIEKNYPFEEAEVDTAEFDVRAKDRVKHNYKDFKPEQLKADLVKDLKIPKKAKIGKARGAVPKTSYKVKSNMDADGNPVYVRNKWEHGTPQADIDWTYKGYKYYAKVELVDGKWRGDIYKTKIGETKSEVEVKTEQPKVVQPENIVEDIHGVYDMDESEKAMFQDFRNYIIKKLGLDKKAVNSKAELEAQKRIIKEFGRVVREKHGFKTIDEAIDYYKKKYNIDFEFVKSSDGPGELGKARIITENGKLKGVKLFISNDVLNDTDLAFATLRHEIEHIVDYYKNPEFKSKPYKWTTKKDISYADFFDKSTGKHFSTDAGSMYELNYIANYEMDNILTGGKINKTVVKDLNLDMIPNDLGKGDIEFIKQAVEDGKGEEAAKRLKKLKTQLSNYFTLKRGLKDILYSEYNPGVKAEMAKDYLRTNLLLPFENAEKQMQNAILKAFEIDVNGNKLNPEKVLDLFEENKGNILDYVFYGGKIPDELSDIKPQLETLKTTLNKIVDDIQDKSIAKRDDIINTLCYDRNLTFESLIPDSEIKKYLDSNKNFDLEKFMSGKIVKDNLTGSDVPERMLPFREKFAELNFKFFNSARDVLEHELNRKELKPERIIKAIQEARKCMTLDDFTNTLKKYRVEEIESVRTFLEEHQDLFKEIENQDIEAAIIKSKKENAMRFFTKDMQSFKGTEDNPAKGTFAHKLSRFVDAEYEGYISHANVTNFVRANRVDQRLGISKFLRDISAAHAIKETFPKMGNTGFNVMFDTIQKEGAIPQVKTFVGELEAFIKSELGEKLGITNKPSRATIDKLIQGFIKYQNKINLSGPKAIKELGQEPLSMARASTMLFGGKGFVGTYAKIMKSMAILMEHGELLEKYNKALGSKWKESIPLEFYNILQDDLNDFTGYRKARLEKYGTNGEKILAKIDSGLDVVNMYSHTQRTMKLAAHIMAGDNLDTLTNAKNLEELFKTSLHYVKKMMRDLEINDVEYALLKNFKGTKAFKELGVFDEVEFKDSLTLEKYSELLGREITEEEFEVLSEATTKKAKRMYDKIVSDISPTETTGAGRAEIEMIDDSIRRNFMRLMGNFKSSIQEQWRRAVRDYYLSNIDSDTGKFDWSNKVWQKQLMSNILGTGMAIATISTISDAEFYADPIEYISEKVDDLIDEPGSALWGAVSENFNLWGLTTGSNVVRRPISFAGQVSKGEWDKAAETLVKGAIGTTNFNIGKKLYDSL